jgi:hypothetical protein
VETPELPSVPLSRSQFFTLRVWDEEPDSDPRVFRMHVKHVLTGEQRYFHDWAALHAYLIAKVLDTPDQS